MNNLTNRSEAMCHPDPESVGRFGVVWLAVAVVGIALVASDCNWHVSTLENYQVAADSAVEAVAEGNIVRKVSYLTVALVGLLLVRGRGRRQWQFRGPLAALIAVYLAWCFVSVLWSVEPAQSLKRLGVVGCCLIGVWGVSRHMTPKGLTLSALWVSLSVVVLSVTVEIALGTFRPWDSAYRFSGIVHPNTQGVFCALLCLSAFFAARIVSVRPLLCWGPLLIGALLLLMTKSLTTTTALLVASVAVAAVGATRRHQGFVTIVAPIVTYVVLLMTLCVGADGLAAVNDSLQVNRAGTKIGDLNGRLPLWSELMGYIDVHPLVGYGYDSFWTPLRIDDVSTDLEWTVPNAHSAYLESLLNVGLLGATLLAVTVLVGLGRCVRAVATTQDPGDRFVLALLLFALVSATCESVFYQPVSFPAFIAACGFVTVAFRDREGAPADRLDRSSPSETDPPRQNNALPTPDEADPSL